MMKLKLIKLYLLTSLICLYAGNYKFVEIPEMNDSLIVFKGAQKTALRPSHINLLVWNMYKGKNSSWKNDFSKLSRKSDLLALQEMHSNSLMLNTLKEKSFDYDFAISFIFKKDKTQTGVINGGSISPTRTEIFRTSFVEPLVHTPKMTVASFYPIQNSQKELLLVNIHAINIVSSHVFADQVLDVSGLIKDHDGPVIFAGDFNTWSQAKTDLMFEIMASLGLKEVKFEQDFRMKKFGFALDHIFYKGLRLKDSNSLGNILGSDHTPMTASFSFQESD